MAGVTGTFVPTYQGLSALDFVRPVAARAACFPFDVPHRLPFYRARNAIYHLFRALVARNPALTVLAPDYNSGNEILAMRAAGATIHYCPVDRRMQLDPDAVERLCARHDPDVLYVIHYAGWPQPMTELVELCRRRGMRLVEDCALSLLSDVDGRPLGSFGDWSVFCLYKTLPLPNGALLVQNRERLDALERLHLAEAGPASVLGRTAELMVQRCRGRSSGVGGALLAVKRSLGRAAGALDVRRANVGDIGFNLDEVDLAMSRLSTRLLERIDCHDVRRRRIDNYRRLDAQLDARVARVFPRLPDGACPLFFPVLVADKPAAARALQRRGIDALEFWNESMDSGREMSADARFLREHVLELPIHQDLTPRHIAHIARQVSELSLRGGAVSQHPRCLPAEGGSHPWLPPLGGRETAIHVDRVDDVWTFTRLRQPWNELLHASAANTPFLTWEWLHAWWTHLQGDAALRIFCVYAGDRLIAAAPFMVSPGRFEWLSRLEFLGTGHAGSDYLDVIVRDGYEAEALDALASALGSERLSLRLDHVPDISPSARLAARLESQGWTSTVAPGGICPIIRLAGHTWDSYLATLGSAHRANVRRRLRALDQQFRTHFEQVTTEAGRAAALAALGDFHQRRFRAHGGSTAFCSPALRAFQDDATRQALDRGWLRMYVLRLNDAPAAVMYGFLYNRRFYFYQHGFDERYRACSLGLVLMALTIRAAIDEGADTFDLLWGAEPYKWLWTRDTNTLRRIHLFAPHLGGRIQQRAVAARRRLGRLGRLARRVLTPGDTRAT